MATRRKSKKVDKGKAANGRGSVIQRTDGRWVARFTATDPNTGLRKRMALYGSNEQEARAKLDEALGNRASGTLAFRQGREQTLEQYAQHWLKVKAGRARVKTLVRYRGMLEKDIVPTLGHVRLPELSKRHVEALMAGLRKEGRLGTTSINHVRTMLRTLLNDARTDGVGVTTNAAADAKPYPDDSKPVGWLDGAQARTLLDLAETDPDGPLWVLAITSGLRQSELLGLRWSDLELSDWDKATVTIGRTIQRSTNRTGWLVQPPKSKNSRRTVPLTAIACESLERQASLQREARLKAGPRWKPALDSTGQPITDLVFTNRTGGPLMGNVVNKRFRKALKNAGMPTNVTFHGLRHSTASMLQAKHVPARVAMEILGHANISTTLNIYSHGGEVAHREAVGAINEALSK
jgi:integrase